MWLKFCDMVKGEKEKRGTNTMEAKAKQAKCKQLQIKVH